MFDPSAATIRTAGPKDLQEIDVLFQSAFRPLVARLGYRPGPLDRSFAPEIDQNTSLVAVRQALDSAGSPPLLGCAVTTVAPTLLYVDAIAVAPQAQRRGLGRRLLAAVETLAAELCLPRVRLDTDPALEEQLAFYEACGYREIRRFAAGGGARVRLTKRVETALERLVRGRA